MSRSTVVVEDAWRSRARHPRGSKRAIRGDIHLRLRAGDRVVVVQALECGTIVFLQVDGVGGFATRTTGDPQLDRQVEAIVRRFVRTARSAAAIRQAA